MKNWIGTIGGICVALAALGAQAAPVTVSPWHTAGNGNITWPGGNWSISGLQLTAIALSDWGNAPQTDWGRVQAYGFSDLGHVTYISSGVGDIGLMPTTGNTSGVTLYDFDLGVWGGTSSNVAVRIYNGDYSQILSQGAMTVGAQHGSFLANVFSPNGIHIQFSSLTNQVAIDNIRLEGGNPLNIAPVPEPETYAMFLAGLGLMGGIARRRKRQQVSA